ncbi:C-X-C motif chemokine 14 [Heptranchias perlo]|uniref:C-X-C motif chemokine 14 n=1 Tax=Heptranchias perlo TaxID=212740 RepID=UPI0035594A19
MKWFVVATVLLLLIAICSIDVEAYRCKCTRKGPKIRYKDVQKVEVKPRHPYCKEQMVFVTMEKAARFKGQPYCLHPKLQSTKNLIKRYREAHRVYLS